MSELVREVTLECNHTMIIPADKKFQWVVCGECGWHTRLGEQDEELAERGKRNA